MDGGDIRLAQEILNRTSVFPILMVSLTAIIMTAENALPQSRIGGKTNGIILLLHEAEQLRNFTLMEF